MLFSSLHIHAQFCRLVNLINSIQHRLIGNVCNKLHSSFGIIPYTHTHTLTPHINISACVRLPEMTSVTMSKWDFVVELNNINIMFFGVYYLMVANFLFQTLQLCLCGSRGIAIFIFKITAPIFFFSDKKLNSQTSFNNL